MSLHIWHLALLMCLTTTGTPAQGRQLSTPVNIPFQFYNGLMLLQVNVNSHPRCLTFVFDTGASQSVVDNATANLLSLATHTRTQVDGAGSSATLGVSRHNTLEVQQVTFQEVELLIADLQPLSSRLGTRIDGIIGSLFFQSFVVHVDFDMQVLQLAHRVEDLPLTTFGSKLPLYYASGLRIPLVALEMGLKNGQTAKGLFFLDSGASLHLLFNEPFARRENLVESFPKTYHTTVKSLTASTEQSEGLLDFLLFSGYRFNDVPVMVAGKESAGVNAYENIAGMLGNKILSRFNYILDLKGKTLYVQPNGRFAFPLEYPCAGVALKKEAGRIMVEQLHAESPLASLGLERGDELLGAGDYTGNDLYTYKQVLNQPGKHIIITFRSHRSGKVSTGKVFLQRLI